MTTSLASSCDFDIVIAGGGIVGMALAASLTAGDLRVALIEKESANESNRSLLARDERSIALSFVSATILETVGAWHHLQQDAAPIRQIHISEKGRFGATRLAADEYCVPALGYVVPIQHIAAALRLQITQQKNLTIFSPASCENIDQDENAVQLEVKTSADDHRFNTALLVLADGAQSSLRQQAGIESQATDYQQQALVVNVEHDSAVLDIAYERFTTAGPLALLPLSGGRYSVVWTADVATTSSRLSWDEDVFIRQLQQQIGWRVGRLRNAGARAVFPLRQQLASRLAKGRCILVGNAAHTLHPVAGQGLNLALRDVSVLAGLLTRHDWTAMEIVRNYSELRQHDVVGTAAATDALIRVFAIEGAFASQLRASGLGMLNALPWLKHHLARHGMGFRRDLVVSSNISV